MRARFLESGPGLSDAVEPLVGVHQIHEIIATCRVDPERLLRCSMSFLVISQTGVDKPQIQLSVFIARIGLRKQIAGFASSLQISGHDIFVKRRNV